jgi:hypothetical protein
MLKSPKLDRGRAVSSPNTATNILTLSSTLEAEDLNRVSERQKMPVVDLSLLHLKVGFIPMFGV